MATKKTAPAAEPADQPNFEQALERLETIVEELEGGALSLENSIARYEEGVKLSRQLGRTLDQAEKRIERLVANDEEPTTEPLELDEAAAGDTADAPSGRASEPKPATPQLPELPF